MVYAILYAFIPSYVHHAFIISFEPLHAFIRALDESLSDEFQAFYVIQFFYDYRPFYDRLFYDDRQSFDAHQFSYALTVSYALRVFYVLKVFYAIIPFCVIQDAWFHRLFWFPQFSYDYQVCLLSFVPLLVF